MSNSTEQHDLYQVLGLGPTADPAAIRRAYRLLARELHPDVNPASDAAVRFTAVSHAYAVLSDPARRRQYDAQHHTPAARASATGFPPASPARGSAAARGVLRGNDVEITHHVSLRDAASGGEQRVDVPRREVCAICIGSGAAKDGASERCPRCLGTGGMRTNGDECPRCLGSGVIGEPPCPNCNGAGRKQGHTRIVVALPPGVEDGQRLVLKGDGDIGPRNGPRGDLILHLVVDPDPVLRRAGIDILMDLTISAEDAVEGIMVDVPTLKGNKRLRIPGGVRHGAILRIGGAGIRPQGMWWHRGDQFVTVHIVPART